MQHLDQVLEPGDGLGEANIWERPTGVMEEVVVEVDAVEELPDWPTPWVLLLDCPT